MAIPYVAGALRGWTQKQTVYVVTKSVVNFIIQQTATVHIFDMMVQPLQPELVRRKPEEQRAWKWYSIVTKSVNPALKVDDLVIVGGIGYRIDSIKAWDSGGFHRYEATEEFSGSDPMYQVIYDDNGAISGDPTQTIAYQSGAAPTVSDQGTLQETNYTFQGWNTAADGSGTAYAPGDTLTIANSDITLYAQWQAVPST